MTRPYMLNHNTPFEEDVNVRLLTAEMRRKLPASYATENEDDPLVVAKMFMPGTRWTWYVLEFDGDDLLFVFVKSGLDERFDELGYASLAELERVRGPHGLRVERDAAFSPTRLSEITSTSEIV